MRRAVLTTEAARRLVDAVLSCEPSKCADVAQAQSRRPSIQEARSETLRSTEHKPQAAGGGPSQASMSTALPARGPQDENKHKRALAGRSSGPAAAACLVHIRDSSLSPRAASRAGCVSRFRLCTPGWLGCAPRAGCDAVACAGERAGQGARVACGPPIDSGAGRDISSALAAGHSVLCSGWPSRAR